MALSMCLLPAFLARVALCDSPPWARVPLLPLFFSSVLCDLLRSRTCFPRVVAQSSGAPLPPLAGIEACHLWWLGALLRLFRQSWLSPLLPFYPTLLLAPRLATHLVDGISDNHMTQQLLHTHNPSRLQPPPPRPFFPPLCVLHRFTRIDVNAFDLDPALRGLVLLHCTPRCVWA
jgi:hypothetical protein